MLTVTGLTAGYGASAIVHDLSFELREGEITALLGANGAGKSTTLSAISGVVKRFSGELLLDGTPLPPVPEMVARLGVAHVPQGRRVFADLSVIENLTVGSLHLSREAAKAEAARAFELLPLLEPHADRPAGLLSGGQQQMLAIGRAIVARPRVLMIDELSLGLAPKVITDFDPILRRLAGEGMAILMVEQYAPFARRLASELMVMAKGRIVFAGPTAHLTEDSILHASYLGGAPTAPETGYNRGR